MFVSVVNVMSLSDMQVSYPEPPFSMYGFTNGHIYLLKTKKSQNEQKYITVCKSDALAGMWRG